MIYHSTIGMINTPINFNSLTQTNMNNHKPLSKDGSKNNDNE